MNQWRIDKTWTLFLDRDGVINKRKMGGYIQSINEFEFLPHVVDAISCFTGVFQYLIVVTNQQGIGKKIMSERNLSDIHNYMCEAVFKAGGKIDKCYFAPDLKSDSNLLRKPNIGMALLAKRDFPNIDFSRSIMVGDSDSDIKFGTNLGMKTVRIKTVEPIGIKSDLEFESLIEFANWIKQSC